MVLTADDRHQIDLMKVAVREVLSEMNDEMLNITQLCQRIPGMTYHTFKKLEAQFRLKHTCGKYSLNAVKEALQSR